MSLVRPKSEMRMSKKEKDQPTESPNENNRSQSENLLFLLLHGMVHGQADPHRHSPPQKTTTENLHINQFGYRPATVPYLISV